MCKIASVYIYIYMCVYMYIQGVSRLVDITAGSDFPDIYDQQVLDGYGVMTA